MRAMWFSGGFHWIRVKGRPALPSEAPILTMAPHSSYFDAIPVTMTMASIVMKTESKDIPVWGSKSLSEFHTCLKCHVFLLLVFCLVLGQTGLEGNGFVNFSISGCDGLFIACMLFCIP